MGYVSCNKWDFPLAHIIILRPNGSLVIHIYRVWSEHCNVFLLCPNAGIEQIGSMLICPYFEWDLKYEFQFSICKCTWLVFISNINISLFLFQFFVSIFFTSLYFSSISYNSKHGIGHNNGLLSNQIFQSRTIHLYPKKFKTLWKLKKRSCRLFNV